MYIYIYMCVCLSENKIWNEDMKKKWEFDDLNGEYVRLTLGNYRVMA